MYSVYLFWVFAAIAAFILIESVSYVEVEEANSADKSPKHHLLFNPKNILMLFLVVGFLLVSIFLNR
ncbi:conserved hypothetical protein [Vibrio chagasii]|nr:conserved hypothetical protein [Vibrio chagasii]